MQGSGLQMQDCQKNCLLRLTAEVKKKLKIVLIQYRKFSDRLDQRPEVAVHIVFVREAVVPVMEADTIPG